MKVYLVASTTTCLVGIEQCRAYIVFDAQQAAFLQQFAGRVLQDYGCFSTLPPVAIHVYNKGS
ncbi:hypothetical protein [Paraflavitalea pollutisoli]|uniref:hypothetical protein n=1 Tax=Paraflavitalea pollutisoli TaxID=3034143 RepID=UPI0023EC653F|nr:hypothetical protein [Paraflavitalea sp. H1-2-19X]